LYPTQVINSCGLLAALVLSLKKSIHWIAVSFKMSASLKHILLSFEEYERLKHIESEYHKLQSKIEHNLHLPGT
jgi:hypothetical protein